MPDFRLVAPFEPTGDQPQAIDRLVDGLARGLRHQTLLGVTGSGKSLPPDQTVLVGRETVDGTIEWRFGRSERSWMRLSNRERRKSMRPARKSQVQTGGPRPSWSP